MSPWLWGVIVVGTWILQEWPWTEEKEKDLTRAGETACKSTSPYRKGQTESHS